MENRLELNFGRWLSRENTTEIDNQTTHTKVLEMTECCVEPDTLKEMSRIRNDKDVVDASTKWLSLATVHGISSNANEISIVKSPDGNIKVVAEYRLTELPSPGPIVGDKIIQDIRNIIQQENDSGVSLLTIDVQEGSIDLQVTVDEEGNEESITLLFPY